jgi:tetratricopeptide (TPR) repeat protein
MRAGLLATSFVLLFASTAFAQNVGDTVIVIRHCDIKTGDVIVDKAFPGLSLKVNAVNGKWLWVSNGIPGWIDSGNAATSDDAITFFTEIIRLDPIAPAYGTRGIILLHQKKYDAAVSDLSEAIRLNPAEAAYYNSRGLCSNHMQEWDLAIGDFNAAIRLGPTCRMFNNRGQAWIGKKDYERALADFDEAIRLVPKYATALQNAALLRASCPEAKYRDGQMAVRDATLACKLSSWQDAGQIEILAAAHAEAGDFAEAVRWQEKALGMVPEAQTAELQRRLALYLAGKPYRLETKE